LREIERSSERQLRIEPSRPEAGELTPKKQIEQIGLASKNLDFFNPISACTAPALHLSNVSTQRAVLKFCGRIAWVRLATIPFESKLFKFWRKFQCHVAFALLHSHGIPALHIASMHIVPTTIRMFLTHLALAQANGTVLIHEGLPVGRLVEDLPDKRALVRPYARTRPACPRVCQSSARSDTRARGFARQSGTPSFALPSVSTAPPGTGRKLKAEAVRAASRQKAARRINEGRGKPFLRCGCGCW
jgi:hypothetical protein